MAKAESCHHCVYSRWDRNLAMWTLGVGMPVRPTCANQPDFPGRWKECPLGRICKNFRARPPTPKGETVKTISLGGGFVTYVDAADFEWLSQWTWFLHGAYVARWEKDKLILMHREIMKPPKGMIVDHKKRNKLDNTRENLRNATPAQNAQNRTKRRGSSSRFVGVSYMKDRGKYRAYVGYEGQRFRCGNFTDEMEAARAHDYKAVELYEEFARVNFPEEWPPERRREVHAQWEAAQKRAGATHALPVQGRGKKAKKKQRKTGRRAGSRATGHRSRATKKKAHAETQGRRAQRRKTKSERATGHGSRGTASKRPTRTTHDARHRTKPRRGTTGKSKGKRNP